jgi:hypothetical protein
MTTRTLRRVSPADVTETELACVYIAHRCPGHGCRALPGELHHRDCDQAACWACGDDRADCAEHFNIDQPSVWLGVDPLDAIAARLGWWIADPELGACPRCPRGSDRARRPVAGAGHHHRAPRPARVEPGPPGLHGGAAMIAPTDVLLFVALFGFVLALLVFAIAERSR